MTIRIPKWLLWAGGSLLIVGAIAAAFSLGRSDGESTGASSGGAEGGGDSRAAACTKGAAERATLRTGFADAIRDTGTAHSALEGSEEFEIDFFTEDVIDFQVAVLKCADLTGDGLDEMLVGISAGASGRILQWAIFTPDASGNWDLAFHREGSRVDSIELVGNAVRVRTPTFGRDDPLCCPSGFKQMRVAYGGDGFEVLSPPVPEAARLIQLDEGRVVRLGDLNPLEDSPVQALAELGTPTGISNYPDDLCRIDWGDLGLTINFANFGGSDPCGPEGRIGSFDLLGSTAHQAGWHTDAGARTGMSNAELDALYPGARHDGRELILLEVPSPIGTSGTVPIATAYMVHGRALAFRFWVGAAGE